MGFFRGCFGHWKAREETRWCNSIRLEDHATHHAQPQEHSTPLLIGRALAAFGSRDIRWLFLLRYGDPASRVAPIGTTRVTHHGVGRHPKAPIIRMRPWGANHVERLIPRESGSKNAKICIHPRRMREVWDRVVEMHGVDWTGFERIKQCYHDLHNSPSSKVRPISVELWEKNREEGEDRMVSGEIGVLCGACYTCLTLFNEKTPDRCGRVRTLASIIGLWKLGVRLYDVGTTAEYYCSEFGFQRTTRREFITQWRRHRDDPPIRIDHGCLEGVFSMLSDKRTANQETINDDGASKKSPSKSTIQVRWLGKAPAGVSERLVEAFFEGKVSANRATFPSMSISGAFIDGRRVYRC